jgi:HEAT repeat protein
MILTNAIAPGTRLGAIDALSGMGTSAALVPILLRYLDDENDMVASAAVRALGAAGPGDPIALRSLEKIALGSRLVLRGNALEALSHFGEQAVPTLIRALGETNNSGYIYIAFHMLAFGAPTAITNSEVVAIAAGALRSPDAERREWAAYALRAIGQRASGVKPDFMMPISRQDMRFEDATNVLRRLAPQLLGDNPSR